MNKYNEFIAKSSIQQIFGKKDNSLFFKYKSFLLENTENTFDKSFNTLIVKTKNTLEKKAIYFSFHLGPFLYIPKYLIQEEKRNIRFIVSSGSKDKVDFFLNSDYTKDLNLTPNNFIYGDSISGTKEILSSIKKGDTIFVLIDIMVGINSIDDTKNLNIVELLNTKLKVRSAILNLAYKLKYPLIQTMAYWENNTKIISFEHVDYSNISYEELIKKIWFDFSIILKKYPMQWESYHTIYKFLQKEYNELPDQNTYNEIEYIIDSNSFEFFYNNHNTYIGSYYTSNIFYSSAKLVKILEFCISNNIRFTLPEFLNLFTDKEIVFELFKNRIICKYEAVRD